jgi:hypothetical protein
MRAVCPGVSPSVPFSSSARHAGFRPAPGIGAPASGPGVGPGPPGVSVPGTGPPGVTPPSRFPAPGFGAGVTVTERVPHAFWLERPRQS